MGPLLGQSPVPFYANMVISETDYVIKILWTKYDKNSIQALSLLNKILFSWLHKRAAPNTKQLYKQSKSHHSTHYEPLLLGASRPHTGGQ